LTIRYSDVQGGWAGAGNIANDPKFDLPDQGKLRLGKSSPCVDAADGGLATPLDLEAKPRYDCPTVSSIGTGVPNYVDIGAYERQGPQITP
jgi:hypothetical protein